jgi:hypothetical protein
MHCKERQNQSQTEANLQVDGKQTLFALLLVLSVELIQTAKTTIIAPKIGFVLCVVFISFPLTLIALLPPIPHAFPALLVCVMLPIIECKNIAVVYYNM